MSRWMLLALLLFGASCNAENPCIPLVEQACLMAKQKALELKGDPEGAAKVCEEAKVIAQKADEAMQARCLEDPASFRKFTKPPTSQSTIQQHIIAPPSSQGANPSTTSQPSSTSQGLSPSTMTTP